MPQGTGYLILTAAEWAALDFTSGTIPEFPTTFSNGATIADDDEVYIANIAWTSFTANDAVAASDYTFDDQGTATYAGEWLIDGTNRIAAITQDGIPISLDYSTFTISQLNSGEILTFNEPSWVSPASVVTPGLYGIPSPGSPGYTGKFTLDGTDLVTDTYTVPNLSLYPDLEVAFTETVSVVGKALVEREIILQPATAWTPYYTEFGSSARLLTPQPLGANTRSFLICVQGTMTEGTTNQQILWMSSDCRVSTDGNSLLRVVFSDPVGANDMSVLLNVSGSALSIGDEFTMLFAYHNGAYRTALKRNASAFITQSNTVTDVDRRMDQALFIGSDGTPSQLWTGGFARIAFWTDVGSLVAVNTSEVQNQFVAADGTPQGKYLTRYLYGNAASGKLRLDLSLEGESFATNEGAVTGITKAAGTLT